jgi:hypothetical protein
MARWFLIAFLFSISLAQGAESALSSHYGETAKRLIDSATTDPHSLDRLEYLCDRIGNRLSGSPSLDRAVAWAFEEMKRAGLENVRAQSVKVPHWVRGEESATALSPLERNLPMLGLGNSVGTPPQGITANVVVVSNFEELTALGADKVRGNIVLFDAPYQGYGRTVAFRVGGASRAAALGAVAVLVRSITPFSLRTPHTGTLIYQDDKPEIPAAAVTIEDAQWMHRLVLRGNTVSVRLKMSAHFETEATSANIIGEIPGSEKPEEIVAMGGHIDSWDVGQGAQDDGSGIMASLEAAALIKRLGLKPRRTIRVVFWVNEENGGAGGRAYRAMLGDDVKNHVAAIEMDGGAEKPLGFGYGEGPHSRMPGAAAPAVPELPASRAMLVLRDIGAMLTPIGANQIQPGGGGSDLEPLMQAGVPGIGQISSGAHYFDWHHTQADTFDKVNPQDFRECVASLAVMSYVLADMPERLSDLK